MDDEISGLTNIGFTFSYNGIDYTQFKASSNGFVNLGGALSDSYWSNDLESSTKKEILAPLWDDLETNTAGSIGYELSGSSGSYILKIEFKNLDFNGDYGTNMYFQVWLYEATYEVEFRYGAMGTWTGQSASIGLNDETDDRFMSITPAETPTYNTETVNNSIATNDYLTNGLRYSFNKGSDWYCWKGASNTDWATEANWYGGAFPTTSQHVTISKGKSYDPIIDETAACNDLGIGDGTKVTVNTGTDLTVNDDIWVCSGGEFELNGGTVTVSDGFRSVANSTVDINGGTLNIGGDWELNSSDESAKGTIELSGGTINITDDCCFSSSDVTGSMTGDFQMTIGDDFKISSNTWSDPTGGTIILTASKDGSMYLFSNNASSDVIAYNLTINGSGNNFYMASTGDLVDQGIHIFNNFTLTTGTVETKDADGHTDKLDVNGTFSMGSGSHFKDAIESTDTYSVGSFSFDAASTYEFYGTAQNIPATTFGHLNVSAAGTKSITGNTTAAGNLSITAGVLSATETNGFTITGTTTNSVGAAGLVVESDASGTGSVIFGGTVTGDVTVERFLTHDRWHYIAGQSNISGNFSTLSMGLTGGVNNDQFYRWDESLDWGGNVGNWVDILNGPNGNDPTMATEGFLACKGYAINYITTDKTLSLSGAPYTVDKSINLTKTTGSLNEGCNLVGNPFTSTLAVNTDAETTNNFLTQNTDVLDASYVAVYLWNEQAGWTYPDNNDYVTINNSSGATYIQAGQAFMVVAKTNGASLSFPAAIRKHGSASFYKNQVNDEVSRFELGVFNPEGQTNSVLIAFIPEMTNGLDPSYDAGKMSGNASLSLYTKLVEDNGHNFAIQALPPLDGTTSVKLGLRAELTGTYKFEPVNVENFNESVSIKLEDKQTGAMIDLTTIPEYSFGINEAGTFDDRFVLHFKGAVGIEEVLESNKIRFYVYDNKLYIIDKELKNATIQLFNMLGQPVMKKQYSQAVNVIDLNLSKGYYIVRIITNKMSVKGKIYVE